MQNLKYAWLLSLVVFSPTLLAQGEVTKTVTAGCKKAILDIAENDLDRQLCLFHPKVFNNSQALIDDIRKVKDLANTAKSVCPANLTKPMFYQLESEHPQWKLRQIPFNARIISPNVMEFCNQLHP